MRVDKSQNIERTIQLNENKSELVDLMNKLPIRIRKVMILKYVHDCKDREIAEILKSLRERLNRGFLKVKINERVYPNR